MGGASTSTAGKPADLEFASDFSHELPRPSGKGTRRFQDEGDKRTTVSGANLVIAPVLETRPQLSSSKRTTGIGEQTRSGGVANSNVGEDQLVVEINSEIRARAVNTIQTGFMLRNKSTGEAEAVEEEDNGVVASSDGPTTESVAGHEVIETRERSTTDAARRKRVRGNAQAKTTGHAEQAVGHEILGASRRSGEPKRGVGLREREKVGFEDEAGGCTEVVRECSRRSSRKSERMCWSLGSGERARSAMKEVGAGSLRSAGRERLGEGSPMMRKQWRMWESSEGL